MKKNCFEIIINDNSEDSNIRYLNYKKSICIPEDYKIPSNFVRRGVITFYISKKIIISIYLLHKNKIIQIKNLL